MRHDQGDRPRAVHRGGQRRAWVAASPSIVRSAAAWWRLCSLTATPRLSASMAIATIRAVRDSRRTGSVGYRPALTALERWGALPWGHGRLSREAPAGRAARLLRRRRPGRADGRARARAARRRRSTCARRSCTTSTWSSSCASAARSSSRSDDEVPEGATVVFSAHGVSPAVHAEAAAPRAGHDRRDLPAGDQGPREALKFAADGYTIVLDRPRRPRGGRGHDGRGAGAHRSGGDRGGRRRARGRRSRRSSPTSRRPRCRSTRRARSSAACASGSRRSSGPRTDDICYATTNRQAAVKQMAPQCDLVLVIGSRNSSNSNRLVEVAREHGAALAT